MPASAWDTWCRVFTPRPRALWRIVCFPHAGGSAGAFRDWARLLPPTIEAVAVQYPGRQDRYADPLATTIPAMAEEIARAVQSRLDRRTVFFGHSMGATVAFETGRRLLPRYPSPLSRLVVSARRAPSVTRPGGLKLDDDNIKRFVQTLRGPGAALMDNEELARLVLPVIRNDLRMVHEYRYATGLPLTCPVTAVSGDRDDTVSADDIARWARHTMGGFESHILSGGHFYLEEESPNELIRLLLSRMHSSETSHA